MRTVLNLLKDAVSFIIYLLTFFRKRDGTVILLYHSVGLVPSRQDPYRMNVAPDNFAGHLQVISRQRYGPEIAFDDGYENIYENAFPLLLKYKKSATVFLTTDFIDGKIGSERFSGSAFKLRPLTWDQIRKMDGAGIKFGSHSKGHAPLSGLSKEEMAKELAESKKRIEDNIGRAVREFAYPFGSRSSFNEAVKDAVRAAGYERAYSNIMGCNSSNMPDKLELRRIRVYTEDGPFKVKMKIGGAYDWVDYVLEAAKCWNRLI